MAKSQDQQFYFPLLSSLFTGHPIQVIFAKRELAYLRVQIKADLTYSVDYSYHA